jgi:hypothetical protein
MQPMPWHRTAALVALGLWLAGQAGAAPLDLADPTPRWIEVRFEISPSSEPGAVDRQWGPYRRAWLDPVADAPAIEIRVPAEVIEAQLRSTGTDTVEGSFSPFVWRLDPDSGHVLNAGLSGQIRERIQLGPFRRTTEISIDVDMTTVTRGGYLASSGALGVETHVYCEPEGRRGRCNEVRPVPYDRERGYVNAVGFVRASAGLIELRAFSPLGEVEFREQPGSTLDSVVSGPPLPDRVCSRAHDRPCPAELGGES